MTSLRRYVIEFGHHFYLLPCALVQSTIPPNLVKISQETKKFIGLQVRWWGGWWWWWWWGGHQTLFLIYYNLALFRFSDGCFDSVGVSFRVGTTLPDC